MVEAPFALKAASSFGHAPGGDEQSENLPPGTVKVLNAGKAGQAQAGSECAERQDNAAHEGFLAQAEDGEERVHNPSMYAGGDRGLVGKRFPQGLKPLSLFVDSCTG